MMRFLVDLIFLTWFSVAVWASDLNNPWNELDQIQKGNYFGPLLNLKRLEQDYLASPLKNDFRQALATALSYVGNYDEAQKYFDEPDSSGSRFEENIKLDEMEALDAREAIINEAYNRRVVMLNEAHHVPETRGLTMALLKPLFDQGYRYFAAETFQEIGLKETIKKGFPMLETGYYIAEPLFADIVREALRIGYTLVPYEHSAPCDYSVDPDGCQDQRERGQAKNLYDRTLKKDPSAKILVHAGYGHIDEKGGSSSFPWTPMAKYFKDISKIDPFTVDQTGFRARGHHRSESKIYRRLIARFKRGSPFVLRSKSTASLWSSMPGHYDIQVILPPFHNQRPDWLMTMMERKEVKIRTNLCSKFPCLIQAIKENEKAFSFVPFDQLYFAVRTPIAKLFLKPGSYFIKFISENAIIEVKQTVP